MMYQISEFNAEKINLRGKNSGQIKTNCPFCPPRTNKNDLSLSVHIDTGQYNCHYCGKHGNIHKFRSMEKQYVKPVWNNRTELSDNIIKWFENRGISQSVLIRAKITEDITFMPQENKEMNVICFNYFRDGELINVKYRDAKKNFKMVKDAERTWYNYDAIHRDELIIVEGEMDALSFMEAGYDNVVSVPNGSKNYDFFDIETLESIKKIYIAVDNDHCGLELKNDLVRRIGAERCVVVDWGDCKDANEYLVKHGRFSIETVLNNAVEVPVSGVLYARDFSREIQDLWQNGLQRGKTIGHINLDNLISFETGRVMVVTGIPGHGKSEFVDEILTRLSVKYGWKSGYFSPENYPLQLHISKLMAKLSGNWISNIDQDTLNEMVDYIDENFFWVLPEDEDFTLETILKKAEYLIKKFGIKSFVVDPWNTIEHNLGNLTETQYISKALTTMSNFAKKYDILFILIAHPKKMEKDSNGVYEIPNLYSISGSSHFYNKADYGMTIYRSFQTDEVFVYVQKVKFRHLGMVGFSTFRNNHNNGRYQEITNGALISWNNEKYFSEESLVPF